MRRAMNEFMDTVVFRPPSNVVQYRAQLSQAIAAGDAISARMADHVEAFVEAGMKEYTLRSEWQRWIRFKVSSGTKIRLLTLFVLVFAGWAATGILLGQFTWLDCWFLE